MKNPKGLICGPTAEDAFGRFYRTESVFAAAARCWTLCMVTAVWTGFATQVQAAEFSGTLACEASLVQPPEAAFSVPATVQTQGNSLTWTREAAGMREVVSAPVVNGVAVLDGYGGSVSANTRQAFWDWRIQAQLIVASGNVHGDVHLLTKDGRTVQRRCKFASTAHPPPVPTAVSETAPATAPTPVHSPPPSTTVAASPAAFTPPPPVPLPPLEARPDASRAAQEEELRKREAALAVRENSVSRRESMLIQPSKRVPASPLPSASHSAAPEPALRAKPASPAKPQSATTLGDI